MAVLFIITTVTAGPDTAITSPAVDTAAAVAAMTVIAETAGPDTGMVCFALFDRSRAASWDDSALMAAEVTVISGKCVWKTAPLPDGIYALAVFHDLNGDDELDKNAVGMPVEPYGFSNDARRPFGPPTISEATFRFDSTRRSVTVRLRR